MGDDYAPSSNAYVGFIGDDGIKWEPLARGSVAFDVAFDVGADVPDVPTLMAEETVTLNVSEMKVSVRDFKWLRRLLGYMRLNYIWQYRKERKGHRG